MRKNNSLLLALLLFILASTAKTKLVESDDFPEAVIDIDGKALKVGKKYYILPVARGLGGGLTLDNIHNKTCPLNIIQEKLDTFRGLPVTFTPSNPNDSVVHLGSDTNILFEASTVCGTSTVWQLDNFDESVQKWFITIGGVIGNPGIETLSNWFNIRKDGDDYIIVFCPGVCDFCRPVCGSFGILNRDSKRILALSSERPLRVLFKRA